MNFTYSLQTHLVSLPMRRRLKSGFIFEKGLCQSGRREVDGINLA